MFIDDLLNSLKQYAKCLSAATSDYRAALEHINEVIDLIIEEEGRHSISLRMTDLLFLRADILLYLSKPPSVQDTLIERLLEVIRSSSSSNDPIVNSAQLLPYIVS